jgi:phosphoribosylformimino-5-aminoimidazole carboxamide ribotide isomerase
VSAALLFPAIDLRNGRVVRLRQGDYADETVYGDDPCAVAESFVEQGATWVHIVDLDAARSGEPVNRPVIANVVARIGSGARVQTGGGVRTVADAIELAAAGVSRVVIGSAALRDPRMVAAASEHVPVAVGLDHRLGELAVHGWTEASGIRIDDALAWFPAADAFVVTDIGRDGMLAGPDLDGLGAAGRAAHAPVIASGGVATIDDILACAALPGCGGVITGKALYEGRFTVADAVAALAGVSR